MIIVMGLPGAGKSSVLKKVSDKVPVIAYGTKMLEIAKDKYNINNRDELRYSPTHIQKDIQKRVAEFLSQQEDKFILDTHCAIKTPNGYLPGLPFELLKDMQVECFVLITATPEEIIRRRLGDKTRKRDFDDLETILEHDKMNRAFLAAYSAFKGVPAKIIHNRDGMIDATAEKIIKLVERLI